MEIQKANLLKSFDNKSSEPISLLAQPKDSFLISKKQPNPMNKNGSSKLMEEVKRLKEKYDSGNMELDITCYPNLDKVIPSIGAKIVINREDKRDPVDYFIKQTLKKLKDNSCSSDDFKHAASVLNEIENFFRNNFKKAIYLDGFGLLGIMENSKIIAIHSHYWNNNSGNNDSYR